MSIRVGVLTLESSAGVSTRCHKLRRSVGVPTWADSTQLCKYRSALISHFALELRFCESVLTLFAIIVRIRLLVYLTPVNIDVNMRVLL